MKPPFSKCAVADVPDHMAANGLLFAVPLGDLTVLIPVCEKHAAHLEQAYHVEPIKTDDYQGEQLLPREAFIHTPA